MDNNIYYIYIYGIDTINNKQFQGRLDKNKNYTSLPDAIMDCNHCWLDIFSYFNQVVVEIKSKMTKDSNINQSHYSLIHQIDPRVVPEYQKWYKEKHGPLEANLEIFQFKKED